MKRKHGIAVLVVIALASLSLFSQADVRYEINLPDIRGYKTLKCDLHVHTVFSDGLVWPTVRVEEAWREGLDVIAVTDHIEYRPHEDDIAAGHNRSHEIAASIAKEKNLLVLRGAEITRDTPPGHFNAVFLADATPLDTEGFLDAVEAANKQRAFVFWNHPGWKGPEFTRWLDVHKKIYENGWLHGIEVVNGNVYYPEAHQWCLEKGLAMLGNSDIHDPARRYRSMPKDHRTMTLVFAEDKSVEALKEALFGGRTAVWLEDRLIGREQYLNEMFRGAVHVDSPHYRNEESAWLHVKNDSDIDIRLRRVGNSGPHSITLAANAVTELKLGLDSPAKQMRLTYVVENFLIAPGKSLPVEIVVDIQPIEPVTVAVPEI